MNRYIKYSRKYRIAIAYFSTAAAVTIAIAVISAALATPSVSFGILSKTDVTAALFFVPSLVAGALMAGLFYWFKAENLRIHGYKIES
jgi:hypothetical protein